ncbi:AT-hook motif nuclear-localized protein 17-like [Vigna radiata var. radiata]|uniref:AT-hook motif nuclear-localized protein 17-like n=1 Tax=Vigna radiata var. radiata TaxID=3916 RepID=A0A1S3VGE2_VIGRR|nr:AT-hook motif nuclear-localized protein 17-like [Vigna radiata var. radiata]
MECIFHIAHKDDVNVTVLNASGTINSVIPHNSTYGATDIIMHGPFPLLSFSGSYFYNNHNTLHPGPTLPFPLCFGINVLTSQDEILGGVIGGSLISGDGVTLTISTFKNPSFLNYTYQVGERHNNDNITSGDFN